MSLSRDNISGVKLQDTLRILLHEYITKLLPKTVAKHIDLFGYVEFTYFCHVTNGYGIVYFNTNRTEGPWQTSLYV